MKYLLNHNPNTYYSLSLEKRVIYNEFNNNLLIQQQYDPFDDEKIEFKNLLDSYLESTPEQFKEEILTIIQNSLKNLQPFVGEDGQFNHKELKNYEEYLKLIISNKLSPYFENELNNAINQTSKTNFNPLMIFFKKDIPLLLETKQLDNL